jgi:hypothetical protein
VAGTEEQGEKSLGYPPVTVGVAVNTARLLED